jgi:hypothetical protein
MGDLRCGLGGHGVGKEVIVPQYSVINPQAMTNGQPEDISVVKANFDAISTTLTKLDDSNIAANAGIQLSKLAGQGTFGGVSFTGGSIAAPGEIIVGAGSPDEQQVGSVGPNGEPGIDFAGPDIYKSGANELTVGASMRVTSPLVVQGTPVNGIFFGANGDANLHSSYPAIVQTDGQFLAAQGIAAPRVSLQQGANIAVVSNTITVSNSLHLLSSSNGSEISTISMAQYGGTPVDGLNGVMLVLVNRTGLVLKYNLFGNLMFSPSGDGTYPHAVNATRGFIYIASEGKWQMLINA